jgi:hypothetical protein
MLLELLVTSSILCLKVVGAQQQVKHVTNNRLL